MHQFVILKFFSRFSGLRVNDDKTELFAIGPQNLVQEEFYPKTCTSIKILGIYFDYHKTTRRNLNFNSIIKSINSYSLSHKTVNARENFWNVYCFATNQMREETATRISHDLIQNKSSISLKLARILSLSLRNCTVESSRLRWMTAILP